MPLLSRNDKERTKLLVVTDAEMRSSNEIDVVQIAHRFIYEYLRTKASDIPNDIFTRESFDSESGIISAERIKQDNFEMWAARLSEPDSTIAGRSWHLELTTGKISSGYRFGISGSRAGEQGDEYFVPYRGRKRFLEWHLKKGNSRDPRRDLRIYFFWDEEDEEIVLGYLTGHLDNRLT
jgi:hypothetical protein